MADRPFASLLALCLTLWAPSAGAFYDESTNQVTWPFEGVVELVFGFDDCCTILVSVGQRASGELRFFSNPTTPETLFSFSMELDGGPSTVGGGGAYLLERGPGVPDRLQAGEVVTSVFANSELFVTDVPNLNTTWPEFALRDLDGVAFDGLVNPPDPDLPPVFAPPATLFETRRIRLFWDFFGEPDFGLIDIRIDSLPIPEPATGWLLGAGLASLAIARRRARS